MGVVLSSWFGKKRNPEELEMALSKAKEIVSSTPVVVFSKTYCGYCRRVKELLTQLGATYKVIELDVESDGDDIQAALLEWTGQRTVPNVFIGGKHIGGFDNVKAKHEEGKLVSLLTEAGAIANNSSQL
ncbi:Glutaredoxin [Macleaya cordata]|uniref:Glutaredoxin n=1 Tax=Macleaya cordata TaxID=56857 RepID=A0A200R2S4_MACCD|nr:Glutaredoxin [Macleaya cordata]